MTKPKESVDERTARINKNYKELEILMQKGIRTDSEIAQIRTLEARIKADKEANEKALQYDDDKPHIFCKRGTFDTFIESIDGDKITTTSDRWSEALMIKGYQNAKKVLETIPEDEQHNWEITDHEWEGVRNYYD